MRYTYCIQGRREEMELKDVKISVTNIEPVSTYIADIGAICEESEDILEIEDISIEAIVLLEKLLKVQNDLQLKLKEVEK